MRDQVDQVPIRFREKIALVSIDRRAGSTLRVTARVLEQEAAVVGAAAAFEVRSEVEIRIDRAGWRAVRVTDVVVRNVIGKVRRVVQVVLVLGEL
jgi:hypothetical protein